MMHIPMPTEQERIADQATAKADAERRMAYALCQEADKKYVATLEHSANVRAAACPSDDRVDHVAALRASAAHTCTAPGALARPASLQGEAAAPRPTSGIPDFLGDIQREIAAMFTAEELKKPSTQTYSAHETSRRNLAGMRDDVQQTIDDFAAADLDAKQKVAELNNTCGFLHAQLEQKDREISRLKHEIAELNHRFRR